MGHTYVCLATPTALHEQGNIILGFVLSIQSKHRWNLMDKYVGC